MSLKVYVIEVTSMVQMHSSEKRDDFYFKVRGKKTLCKKKYSSEERQSFHFICISPELDEWHFIWSALQLFRQSSLMQTFISNLSNVCLSFVFCLHLFPDFGRWHRSAVCVEWLLLPVLISLAALCAKKNDKTLDAGVTAHNVICC